MLSSRPTSAPAFVASALLFGTLVGGCGDDGTAVTDDGGMTPRDAGGDSRAIDGQSPNGDASGSDGALPDAAGQDAAGPDAAGPDASADGGRNPTSLALGPNPSATECGAPAGATLEHAEVAEGHCAWLFATALAGPRGITVDGVGDVLVVERGAGRVVALYDDDADRVSANTEREVLVPSSRGLNLNHGIWIHGAHLYASSTSTVFRWTYTAGAREDLGAPEVVVRELPAGGHRTRTLITRPGESWLYVSVGSRRNVDEDSSRSRVMRYDLDALPDGGYEWTDGELFADGLRNEVGLGVDMQGRLWGVQNGVDNLARADLGGDIHADNPAEELNLFDEPGRFHGYPYCWTEFLLPAGVGMGPGTQWAHPSFMDDGTHDDAWCRNSDNVVPAVFAMQAHSAPLDLLYYGAGGLRAEVAGDAFVSFHGSWNRPEPTGYKVVRLLLDGAGMPVELEPFLEYAGAADTINAEWPHRPVGLAVGSDGALLVTSDNSGVVLAVAARE